MPGGTSRTDKDGNFTLSNVAPGEYSVQVQSLVAMMSAATQAMALIERREQTVRAGGQADGARVRGRDGDRRRRRHHRPDRSPARAARRPPAGSCSKAATKPENIASLRLMAAADRSGQQSRHVASAFGMASVKETGDVRDRRPGRRPDVPLRQPAEGLVPQTHHARRRRRHRQGLRLQAGRRRRRLRDRADAPARRA